MTPDLAITYRSYPDPQRRRSHIYEAVADTELGVVMVWTSVPDDEVAAAGSLSHAVGEINRKLEAELLEKL